MRVLYALVTLTLCAGAAAIGVALAPGGGGAVAATGPEGFAGAVRPPGAMAPDLRLRDADGQLDHSAYVVLVDARGRQRVGFPHTLLTDADLAHDLRRLGA